MLFANSMGFAPQEFFNLDEGERKAVQTAPNVKF
jgi:LemA protein